MGVKSGSGVLLSLLAVCDAESAVRVCFVGDVCGRFVLFFCVIDVKGSIVEGLLDGR